MKKSRFLIAPSDCIKNDKGYFKIGFYSIKIEGFYYELYDNICHVKLIDPVNIDKKNIETQKNTTISINSNGVIEFKIQSLSSVPLFYTINSDKIILTDNISNFKELKKKTEIDQIGLLQRLTGPDYCYYGERSMLKNVLRTFPYTQYHFNVGTLKKKNLMAFQYGMQKPTKSGMESLKEELFRSHEDLVEKYDKIDIALSGGLDSRISAGIIFEILKNKNIDSKKIMAITYGSYWNYETRIAERLATKLNFNHLNVWDDLACWPRIEEFENFYMNGGNIGISSWNNFLHYYEKNSPNTKQCLILGDLLESLAGRKLTYGLSRFAKVKSYWNKGISKNLSQDSINSLKGRITSSIISRLKKVYEEIQLDKKISLKEVIEATCNDLEFMFDDCRKYGYITEGQFYEIFQWLVYSTFEYRNQTSYFHGVISAYSPASKDNILAEIVKIDPRYRKGGELLTSILRSLTCFNRLNFPIASSPYIKIGFPTFIRDSSKFLRFVIDSRYKKSRMADKDISARGTFLNSVNWVKIYNLFPEHEYKSNFREEEFSIPLKIIEERKKILTQPLVNYDVVNWFWVFYLASSLKKDNN
jgi:hypothetical protein